jgi:hypothetical protein
VVCWTDFEAEDYGRGREYRGEEFDKVLGNYGVCMFSSRKSIQASLQIMRRKKEWIGKWLGMGIMDERVLSTGLRRDRARCAGSWGR